MVVVETSDFPIILDAQKQHSACGVGQCHHCGYQITIRKGFPVVLESHGKRFAFGY